MLVLAGFYGNNELRFYDCDIYALIAHIINRSAQYHP